jgi:hypothetical protein
VLGAVAAAGVERLTPDRLARVLGAAGRGRRTLGMLRAAGVLDADGLLHPFDAAAALAAGHGFGERAGAVKSRGGCAADEI